MKTPEQISLLLARQWEKAQARVDLTLDAAAWPRIVEIPQPTPRQLERDTSVVRAHLQHWRSVAVGHVRWQPRHYRSVASAIELPVAWEFASLQEWATAAGADVQLQAQRLQFLQQHAPQDMRGLLARRRALWRERSDEDVVRACAVAALLTPGIAQGQPLRSLALGGMDTKFLERHQGLVTALLDQRFDNQASAQGLAAFLGGQDCGEHWLRVVPLTAGLLPFDQIRVRASELMHAPLPGTRLLLVENEHCVHLLPALADTVAVLGSGLDLGWLQAPWLRGRAVCYWGDMDSWGLLMLGRARLHLPQLQRVLMDRPMFDRYCAALAVKEPVPTDSTPPLGLDQDEQAFHRHLLMQPKGRIEQELLPREAVLLALQAWGATHGAQ